MDTVTVNGATIAKMVDVLTRELDIAQKKLEESKQEKEKAQVRIEELNLANNKLREKVDELESARVKVMKREVEEDNKPLLTSLEAQNHNSQDVEKDARIAELEKSLDEYRGMYQAMLRERGSQTRDDAESSLAGDDGELEELEGDDRGEEEDESESEEEDGEEEGDISGICDLESAHTRNAFGKILGNFPQAEGRPKFKKLRPVCVKGTNLKDYLASDPRTSWCSKSFLYLPGRFVWCSERKDHALVFGPIFAFRSQGWRETHSFSYVREKTIELFFPHKGEIYYGGSYVCHSSRQHNEDGFRIQQDTSARTLADVSIDQSAKNRNEMCKVVERMYCDGVLKAECLGLQCVGFNHGLNGVLSQKVVDQKKTSRKRKAGAQANPRKSKKAKT